MKCFYDEHEARGVCRFCGRGLCKEDHMNQTLPFITSVYVGAANVPKAIVVADALWCGVCQPQPEPIEMPEIS